MRPHDLEDADDRRHGLQISIGQPFIYPRNDLDYSSNFLHMCFAVRARVQLDQCLSAPFVASSILHADDEQNASTSTVRLAGSSGANPFACISAGIACLWGPAQGGANEGSAHDVAGDWYRSTASGVHQARQGSERSLPADGLWPSGL